MFKRQVIRILASLLPAVLKAISPKIREAIEESVHHLYDRAKETENPHDDLVVELLASILKVTL